MATKSASAKGGKTPGGAKAPAVAKAATKSVTKAPPKAANKVASKTKAKKAVPAKKAASAKASASTAKATRTKVSSKRELIAPNGDKRYIRRDETGRISESDDVGRSLSQDQRRKASTVAEPGQGDRGDGKRSAKKAAKKET